MPTREWDAALDEEDVEEYVPAHARSPLAGAIFCSLVVATVASATLTVLVLTRDPDVPGERAFVGLALAAAAGLASAIVLAFGRRTGSPIFDMLRGFRRGALFGLACAGVVVLQLNAAFNPANLAFLLLVLLIVEMIFLARRQNAP